MATKKPRTKKPARKRRSSKPTTPTVPFDPVRAQAEHIAALVREADETIKAEPPFLTDEELITLLHMLHSHAVFGAKQREVLGSIYQKLLDYFGGELPPHSEPHDPGANPPSFGE